MTPTFISVAEDESDEYSDEAPATPQETREEFLARTGGAYAKVRHSLIQLPGKQRSNPAMLPKFSRNHRALVLYLALLANRPWLDNEDEPLAAAAWVRFLTCDDPKALTWTPQSLSHAWGVLEDLNLVTRPRKGRLVDVQPRREDGKAEYRRPIGTSTDPYFLLPHEFWLRQLHGTLSWPGLAVLLILLKESGKTGTAQLAIDRARDWYGISRTTAEAGLAELRGLGYVSSRGRLVKDVTSPDGRRKTSVHTLLDAFSLESRVALRTAARERVRATLSSGEEDADAEAEDEAAAE